MILYDAFYRLGIGVYTTAIRIAAMFDHKAKLFIKGREGILQKMKSRLEGEVRPRIWMHCASLGEFEQGRPVLEDIRLKYPHHCIILTFFSPSGYEVRKEYTGADHVFYLPVDTGSNARQFLDSVSPALCIFVKYEFWHFYLSNIAARHIPLILISAAFSERQIFFRWYGRPFRGVLRHFTHIFVQDAPSKELLHKINVKAVTIGGDTRFDRVIEGVKYKEELPVADSFCKGHKIIVAGSTWPADERLLYDALQQLPAEWKLILVPHEVDKEHIAEIEKNFKDSTCRWSKWGRVAGKRVLIVDQVGLLLQLYRYGNVAWIGGGFGDKGVHNVLEAAVYGIPCFYGPVFHQFIEAGELIEAGGGFTVKKAADLADSLKELEDTYRYQQHAYAAKGYVLLRAGASELVMNYIHNLGLKGPERV